MFETKEKQEQAIKDELSLLAQEALTAQDACNLSGLLHTMSDVASKLWRIAHVRGEGTSWVNTHPILQLYILKCASLADLAYAIDDQYPKTRDAVKALIQLGSKGE